MAGRDIMTWMRRIFVTLALAYALLLAGCSAMQRSLMYFPLHDLPGPVTVGGPARGPPA